MTTWGWRIYGPRRVNSLFQPGIRMVALESISVLATHFIVGENEKGCPGSHVREANH